MLTKILSNNLFYIKKANREKIDTKKSYLKAKRSFWREIKTIFPIFKSPWYWLHLIIKLLGWLALLVSRFGISFRYTRMIVDASSSPTVSHVI